LAEIVLGKKRNAYLLGADLASVCSRHQGAVAGIHEFLKDPLLALF
jgi:hypothetical protein